MSPKKTSKKAVTKKAARKGSRKTAKRASTKRATKSPAKLQSARAFAPTVSMSSAKLAPIKAQEIKVRYVERAYKFSAARNKDEIHPRKVLPKPPAGPKVLDTMPTAPLALEEFVSTKTRLGLGNSGFQSAAIS